MMGRRRMLKVMIVGSTVVFEATLRQNLGVTFFCALLTV
jgi:hypothetical protein